MTAWNVLVENALQAVSAGLTLGALYGLMCVGLALIFSVMRVINFAQGELLTAGMYASLFLFAPLGLGGFLGPYAGPLTQDAILLDIYRQRQVELAFQGFRLEDSRRFGRPGPGAAGAERNRNFFPYPRVERENNSATPADPAI